MNKNKTIIKMLLLGSVILGSATSCKKDYFDINDNPNNPKDVDVSIILPSAQVAIAHAIGNDFQIYGGLYAQYWTQSPSSSQYKTLEQYNPGADEFDFVWGIMYSDALQDLKKIEDKATADGRTQYVAVAKILEGYSFQLLTDNFGDVPYSQALQASSGILSPKYDSQQDIYNGIIATVKSGISMIDENAEVHPGSEDLMYGGDMTLWRKFGNTLLLKMYLRLSERDPGLASAGIAELAAASAEFIGTGESGRIQFLSQGGNTNPLYAAIIELGSTQNLVASSTSIDYMINNNDPRLYFDYAPALNFNYVGLQQGLYTAPAGTPTSYPSPVTGGFAVSSAAFEDAGLVPSQSAPAPVNLISGSESMFLQSEAAARGWLTGADAQLMYESGIAESFTEIEGVAAASGYKTFVNENYADLADSTLQFYLAEPGVAYPAGGTVADQVKAIITQKWTSLCGRENIEAWTEWRRTGYPEFFNVSAASLIGASAFPQRLPYPSTEITRNGNFPGQKLITDKVWWDNN